MFIRTNDSITMLPIDSMDKFEAVIKERLGTEVVKIASGTPICSAFTWP